MSNKSLYAKYGKKHGIDLPPPDLKPGDVVTTFFRWPGPESGNAGKDAFQHQVKERPCVVLETSPDGRSFYAVPISRNRGFTKGTSHELPREDCARAGLRISVNAYVQVCNLARFDLPNTAIIPHTTKDGNVSWKRGEVSRRVLDGLKSSIKENAALRSGPRRVQRIHMRADGVATRRPFRIHDIGAISAEVARASGKNPNRRPKPGVHAGDAPHHARPEGMVRSADPSGPERDRGWSREEIQRRARAFHEARTKMSRTPLPPPGKTADLFR